MKALVGAWDNRPYRLLAEVSALRARVAELQAELEEAHAENAALRDTLTVGEDPQITVAERAVALSGS